MLIFEEIRAKVLALFGYTPTHDQSEALDCLLTFLMDRSAQSVFMLRGYAGTGKTSLISALIRYLDSVQFPSVLMAPTGRAAKVFSAYSRHPATTIHKKIYRQKVVDGSNNGFSLGDNRLSHALFFVDEASMISDSLEDQAVFGSGRLLEDMLRYIYNGNQCKLVLMGDTAQLPPVGKDISPALDPELLRSYGMEVAEYELKEVVRQTHGSQLLDNATRLRLRIAADQVDELPQLQVDGEEVVRLMGEDFVETVQRAYQESGMEECKVICRSNKRAVMYNLGIRSRILNKEEELSSGDLLLVAKNNYFWSQEYKEIPFIANGDLMEVLRVRKTMEMYGFRFADLSVRFPEMDYEMDVRVLLDSLTAEAPSLDKESQDRLYHAVLEDYADCRNRKELYEALKKDPWFNALQVKYGYAMTCHKSQGGQWKHIFLDQGYVTEDMMGLEYFRWLYTAVTRSTSKLYLVNFKDEFIAQ